MRPLSDMIRRIGTETAFKVGPEIQKLIDDGWDIIKLTLGEPSCDIPAASTEAMKASLDRHETHYVAPQGIPEVRKAIAEYMTTTRGVDYTADHICLTPGAKTVICGFILSCVNPGDEVLIPSPGYPIYESMVRFVGAKPVDVPILEEKGFSLDVADLPRLITDKTTMIIVNSPANPTGGVISKEDIGTMADLAKKHDLWVLSDEIYSRIVFGEGFDTVEYKGNKLPIASSIASLPGMAERTMILDGFSKTYAMTGLRIGFGCMKHPEIIGYLTNLGINFWACIPQPTQYAGLAALGEDQREAMHERQEFEEKRDILVEGLNDIPGLKCYNVKGSFYLFVNVTEACKTLGLKDSEEFRKYVLTYDKANKKGVAVLSRQHFGARRADEKEEYIRIAFPGSKEDLRESLKRIREAVLKPATKTA